MYEITIIAQFKTGHAGVDKNVAIENAKQVLLKSLAEANIADSENNKVFCVSILEAKGEDLSYFRKKY